MGNYGYSGTNAKNDVWTSNDGSNWTQLTPSANWCPRGAFTSIVFNNKMWIFGGDPKGSTSEFKNDIWSSSDGVNWTLETPSADWSISAYHSAVIYKSKLFILTWNNELWRSINGINWEKVSNAPANSNYCNFIVYNDRVLLYDTNVNSAKSKVWSYSE